MSARAAIAVYLLEHQGEDVFTLGEGVIAALEVAGFSIVPMKAPERQMKNKPKPKKREPHELLVFLAVYAVEYAKNFKLDGLHPRHYDLMVKYGARMDDFKRATKC